MQPPIWKKNVNVSGFAERNRLAIEDENRRLREAERSEPRSEPMGVPKMKSGIGTVKFDLGGGVWDERDAEELADDPTYGGVAHEALWKRDMKAARDEADAIGLELSNPSAFLTKEQRQKMLDDGILLSEDDPRHKEIKAQLIADEEKRPALEQKQWDAKKRAQDLARMGPKGYQELRQQQKLQGVAQASQSITAQEAEIRAKDAEGVSGRDLEEHQLAKQQILAQKQDIQSQAQSLVVPDKRVTAVTQNGVRTEYDPNTQPNSLDDYDNDLDAAEQKILDAEKSGQADPASLSAAKAELTKNRDMIASARKETREAEARKTAIGLIGANREGKILAGKKEGIYESAKDFLNSLFSGEQDRDPELGQVIAQSGVKKSIKIQESILAAKPENAGLGADMGGGAMALAKQQEKAKKMLPKLRKLQEMYGDDADRIATDAAKEYAWTEQDEDKLRSLSSGELVINPSRVFGNDKAAVEAEIAASYATPEQKQTALRKLEGMRSALADKLESDLYISDNNFKEFADKWEGDKAGLMDAWAKQQKDRNWFFKLGDAVVTGVQGGAVGVTGTVVGGAAGISALVGADKMAGAIGETGAMIAGAGESVSAAGKQRGLTGGLGVATDIANTVTQMAPMLVGGYAAQGMKPLAAAVTQGMSVYGWSAAQGYGSKLQDALVMEQEKLGRPLSEQEIAATLGRPEVQIAGFANAAQTAMLAKILPGGSERIASAGVARKMTVADFLKKGGRAAMRDAGLKAELKQMGKTMFADATDEMLEEGINQMLDGIISTAALGKDMQLGDLMEESLTAALMGGVVGGALPQARFSKAEKASAALVAQGQAAPTPEEQRKVDEVAGTDADVDQQVQYTKAQREISAAEPEAAERATATLKLARGASMDELTANEVRSLGVTRDGSPLSPDVPAMVEIVNGRPIVLDGAIQELEAIAPSAKGLVTMTEGEARSKFSKQPFTVISKSGAVIQVDAKDPAEAEKIGAQRFDLGDPVETVTLAATGGASVGTTAPPAPTPAGATTAQPVADQTPIEPVAQSDPNFKGKESAEMPELIPDTTQEQTEIGSKIRSRLGALATFTNQPEYRLAATDAGIIVNLNRLSQNAADAGLSDKDAEQWIEAAIDEELFHFAHLQVAKDQYKKSGDSRSFTEWRNTTYAKKWTSDYVQTGRYKVIAGLYSDLDTLAPWARYMEAIRMEWQQIAKGSPTENARLSAKGNASIVKQLQAMLEKLKDMVKSLTPTMRREIAIVQAHLKKLNSDLGAKSLSDDLAEKLARNDWNTIAWTNDEIKQVNDSLGKSSPFYEQNNKRPAAVKEPAQAPVPVQPVPVGETEKPVPTPPVSKGPDAATAAPQAETENVATPVELMTVSEWADANLSPAQMKLMSDTVNSDALLMPYYDAIIDAIKAGRPVSESAYRHALRFGVPSSLENKARSYRWQNGTYVAPKKAQENSKKTQDAGLVVGQEVTGKVTSENDVDHGKTMSGTVFKTGEKYILVTVPSRPTPVRMAVGDVTTVKGQELSVKQGELAVNEPQASKPKAERKPRKAKALQRHMEIFMQNPVVIALIDSGGVMSKSMAQKVYGKDYVEANKSLWDDMPEMRNPAYSVIWSGENGNRPDQAAATLGYDSSTDLWDALGKVINNSQKQAIQEREADANMSQAEDFARVKDDGPYRVNVDEMSKGDKLVIDGENFTVATVTRKDGEVAKVVLEDGARFGRQTLEGGEEVWVEEFDDGTPEMTAEEAAARDAADQARVPEPEWMPFEKSLGIPRSEMPQIKASDRAAMVQFLKARGIDYREETMPANRLKATQVEYSPEKVRNYEGGDRSILISGDNYVVDGHHQWLAAGDGDIKVIRLLAPIRKVLATVSEMPSVETAKGEKPAPVTTKPAEKVEAESPTIAQLNDPSYFSQRVIQEIDDAIAQYTNNGKRKISDVFGKSEESRRVKMFIERGNAIRSYAINTKASGPEATFRININKATSFAELRDAAVKLHSKLTSAKTPATKMDIAQTNAKQLFDDDGGFALASQTTQDGDAINKAKADAEAAKEAADKAQGKLFDLTENDKAIADAFDGLFAATLSSGQSKDDGAESLRDESAQNLPRTEVTPRNARKITSRSAKELGIAIARGEAKKNRRYLQEGDESVVERYGNDWVFKSIKDKGIYVYTPDGRLTRSKDFRDLELKAEIINFLGGFETVAITDNEGKYLLQKYGKGIVSEEELESATLPFGLKPNEVNHIEHNGQQYAISDLHHKNFRKDGEGNIRVIDLIVGKVPVNVTLSDISDSLLAAPLTDRARSEMDEGAIKETMAQQKEFGNVVKPPNRASMGDERTRQVVDAFDIDFETRREKESRDQWVKQGTKKAATGRKDLIENALMNAYGEVGAVPMMPEDMIGTQIVIEQMVQEAGNNYDKLIEAGTIIQAYRKVRGDIARVLASGWDRLMPPDERNRRYLANAILTLPPTIERDISKRGYSPEKTRELIQSELRTRLTKIEKALKEYGVTINEVLGKQVYLSLNKKNIVKDIMAKNTKDEQLAIRMHQQAYDVQKIAKATHMTVTEVQELIDKVYAEALERMKVKARAGATLESLQAAALSEAEIEAEARRMVEIGLGIAPKAHTTATRMMKRKAVNIPTEPAKVNWARPEFTSGLLEYTFDAKDLDAIKQTVQALVDATAAKAKVESITDPAKRAKADALLAKLETILAKYGTDISAVVESGKPLESYRFDITDRVHVHIVANAIRSVDADWIDKGTEYSYFSMLSGIQTFAKNLSSVPWTAFEATAQRGSEAVMNWFFKNPMNATFGEVEYMAKAMQPMLHRAQSNFMASLGAEAPFFEQDILGVPPDLEKVLEGHGMYHRTAISGRKGRRLRIPTRLLMATDEYVKTINAMVEVGAMAYRLCRAANLTPGTPAFDEKIKELVNTPGSLAWQLAAKKAYQRTFSNSLPGETDPVTGSVRPTRTIGEAIGRGVYAASKIGNSKVDTKMAKLAGALFRIAFFPFIKIPYNITATAFNYTALSVIDIAILTAHYILDKKEGKKLSDQKDIQRHEMELMLKKGEVIERLSKMMIGNVLTGLLLGMGLGEGDDDDLEKGLLITGSRPHKKTKTGAKETSERLGIGAYTISWKRKDGTRGTFNYGAIEPLATILATNIDTINQLKQAHRGKQTYGEAIGGISYSFINQLSDKTFLKGFGQLWKMLEGEVDMSQFAADKIGMIMPNLIKQIVRESDPVVRDKAESFSQEVAYAIMPIGQKKAKVDIYGQEVKKRGTAFSRWIDFTESGSVEYRQLDEMMWKAQQKFPKLTLPSSAQATYTVDGQQKTMTANQADMYRKWAGDYFTKRLSTLNLNYENPSDRDVAKIMGIVSESRRLAKKALMKNPNWK